MSTPRGRTASTSLSAALALIIAMTPNFAQAASSPDAVQRLLDGSDFVNQGDLAVTGDGRAQIDEVLSEDLRSLRLPSLTAVDVRIELPAGGQERTLSGGAFALDYPNGSALVPIIAADGGGVQLVSVIEGVDAPTRYRYEFESPGGVVLARAGDAVIVSDQSGDELGVVQAPWAHDAKGLSVPTHFELDGDALIQVVEHNDQFEYPIAADPAYCGALWSGIVTTTEQGQPRYKLYRSACGSAVSTGLAFGGGAGGLAIGQQLMLGTGWNDAKALVPALTSKATLRQQYDCHVFYAFAKPDSWNLERWRPNKSNWASSVHSDLCNWS